MERTQCTVYVTYRLQHFDLTSNLTTTYELTLQKKSSNFLGVPSKTKTNQNPLFFVFKMFLARFSRTKMARFWSFKGLCSLPITSKHHAVSKVNLDHFYDAYKKRILLNKKTFYKTLSRF